MLPEGGWVQTGRRHCEDECLLWCGSLREGGSALVKWKLPSYYVHLVWPNINIEMSVTMVTTALAPKLCYWKASLANSEVLITTYWQPLDFNSSVKFWLVSVKGFHVAGFSCSSLKLLYVVTTFQNTHALVLKGGGQMSIHEQPSETQQTNPHIYSLIIFISMQLSSY